MKRVFWLLSAVSLTVAQSSAAQVRIQIALPKPLMWPVSQTILTASLMI